MKTISIFTEAYFFSSRLKRLAKALVGKSERGPVAVESSLIRGLQEIKQPFKLNQAMPERVISVLSGPKVLRWAIEQKRQGKVKKIIAGPNIVVTPLDHNNLALSPEIDVFLVPAPWVLSWWLELAPQLANKLRVWPAGTEDFGELRKIGGSVLIFQKNGPEKLLNDIQYDLSKRKLPFITLRYGKFKRSKYFNLLNRSSLLVYLSKSESQGLALHEAWMGNVPTLVWNNRVFNYKGNTWYFDNLSAPYFSEECGLLFSDFTEFSSKLDTFLTNPQLFNPRQYVLPRFTDQACAQKYLNILDKLYYDKKNI